jgi:hypothetical protein
MSRNPQPLDKDEVRLITDGLDAYVNELIQQNRLARSERVRREFGRRVFDANRLKERILAADQVLILE